MASTAAAPAERPGGDLSIAQVKAVGQKRLAVELARLTASKPEGLVSIAADEKDAYVWHLVIAPNAEPYVGFFKVRMVIHSEYPFKPPKCFFDTPIYHMNVDPKTNQACIHALQADTWQPSNQMESVLRSLFYFLSYPQPERAVQQQLASLYLKSPAAYLKAAAEFTKAKASTKP